MSASVNGRELTRFLELYSQVSHSQAMSDPRVHAIVTALSKQIRDLSQASATVSDRFSNPEETNFVPDASVGHVVSQDSHANSAGICEVGGSADTGIHCPG